MPATGAIAPLLHSPSCTLRISLSWWAPLCSCREFPNAKSETTGQPPPTRCCKLVSTQRVLKPPLCSRCHPVPFLQLAGKELGQSRAMCAEKATALQGSVLAAAAPPHDSQPHGRGMLAPSPRRCTPPQPPPRPPASRTARGRGSVSPSLPSPPF